MPMYQSICINVYQFTFTLYSELGYPRSRTSEGRQSAPKCSPTIADETPSDMDYTTSPSSEIFSRIRQEKDNVNPLSTSKTCKYFTAKSKIEIVPWNVLIASPKIATSSGK